MPSVCRDAVMGCDGHTWNIGLAMRFCQNRLGYFGLVFFYGLLGSFFRRFHQQPCILSGIDTR